MFKILIIFTFIFPIFSWGSNPEQLSTFPGQVSRINSEVGLMRIRVTFKNAKYLNQFDRVEFWNEMYPQKRCMAKVEGRGNGYVLLKVPHYEDCLRKISMTVGSTLQFWSQDLQNNLTIGKELTEILIKKRLALMAKKNRHQREMDIHFEKVEAVNKRYEVLRQKLEFEWQKELSDLEEDKTKIFAEFKSAEAILNELENKLEAYRIHDQNYVIDRWALDPDLHYKK